jgi:hypothetical protein
MPAGLTAWQCGWRALHAQLQWALANVPDVNATMILANLVRAISQCLADLKFASKVGTADV